MSYILDALKKSQQERQQSSNPTIQSLHQPIQTATPNRWPVIAALACFFSLLISGFMVYQWMQKAPSATAQTVSESKNDSPKVETTRSPELTASMEKPVTAKPVKTAQANPVVANTVLELWQLPDPVQAEIPAMTFSFHVYSNKQERRTIIINGRRLKEGGQVEENLQLLEITETGVVLNWKNQYQFYVPVVESW